MQGRGVGSPGYDKAARYVADQFASAGLKPGAENGFFQQVNFTEVSLDLKRSNLALLRDGKSVAVSIPDEAQLGFSPESAADLEAPIVFAGYGLVVPEAQHDDLQGLPVKGAVVAFLTGGPASISGNLRS